MEQFFRPMRAEEGGVAPALEGDHALTPSERDGSAVTSRDVKTLQKEDSKCRAIITYLTTRLMPQAAKMASFVRQHAKHCIVQDDKPSSGLSDYMQISRERR